MIKFMFLLILFGSSVGAKDLGVFGETFSIQEQDLIQIIQAKLQSLHEAGKLEDIQTSIQEKLKQIINRPKLVEGISNTTKPRTFTYDPSITVPYDLRDHQGRVFHKKGTIINPLTIRPLTKPLLFIDGDDERQVAWVRLQLKHNPKGKPILVKGSPFNLMKALNFPIYFDQGGVMTSKLGITQVPAKVTQQGTLLEITEVLPDEH